MLRKIIIGDENKILTLQSTLFSDTEIYELSYIKNICIKNQGYVYIYNNIYIGYLLYIYDNNNDIILTSIGIDKNYQNKGIGNLLISILLKSVIKNIYLHVKCTNLKAYNLYIKLGFKILKKIDKYYDTDDAYYMIYRTM